MLGKKVGKEDKVEMEAHSGLFSSVLGSRRINIQRVLGAQLGRERVRGQEKCESHQPELHGLFF